MNLPIFRDLFNLNILLMKDIENMPKMYRHSLSDKIINTALYSYQLLQRAYDSSEPEQRLSIMVELSTELNTLGAYLRMANELRAISLRRASDLFVRLENIKKQLSGWRRKTKEKTR